MKPDDAIRAVLKAVDKLVDGSKGEVHVSSLEKGVFGRMRVTETIVIENPTKERIAAELTRIWGSGFQGNVVMQRELTSPYVITLEQFIDAGRRLLMESRI